MDLSLLDQARYRAPLSCYPAYGLDAIFHQLQSDLYRGAVGSFAALIAARSAGVG